MPRRFHFFLLHSTHTTTHIHTMSAPIVSGGSSSLDGLPPLTSIAPEDLKMYSRSQLAVWMDRWMGCDVVLDTFDKDPSDQNGWRCGWWCQAYLLAHGVRPEHTKPRMKAQLREVIRRLTQPQSATANHIAASPALSRTGISLSLSLSLSLSINIFIDHVWCLR
jgi:hypothetical protein